MSKRTDKTHTTWDSNNLFTGTAWYYARYRPDYPEEVFKLLRDRFGLNEKSRVLDLGCGTGQIALKLAQHVSEVIALDPQEDMLQVGKALASAGKINNITWLAGESGKLEDMASQIGKIDITCMGRAFHWMDRTKTLQDLYKITKPGGGIALLGDTAPRFRPEVPWIKVIDDTVKDWLGEERKAGTAGTFNVLPKRHEDFIRESEFTDFEVVNIHQTRQWTIDQIIGYQYSTSHTSIPVLGDKKEQFEADLRKRLRELEPTGLFEEPAAVNVLTARKIS